MRQVEELPITAETLLSDIVARHPATRSVLDRYGLKGCGGALGPRETVAWFARLHDVALDELLRELNEAASQGQRITRFEISLADIIYQPFFKAGSLVAVVFGALWGAFVLARMGFTGGMQFATPYGWTLAHAQAMLFGFVVLFAMGFAYQAFPRFKRCELWNARLAFSTLPLMLSGLALQALAHFFVPPPVFQGQSAPAPLWALMAGTVGTVLQWLAITFFCIVIWRTLRASNKPEHYDPLIFASLCWLWLSASANIVLFWYWGSIVNSETFVERIGTFNVPLRDMQLYGFAMQLIFAVSLRFLPHAYGFPEPRRSWSLGMLAGMNMATLLAVTSFPMFVRTHLHLWATALELAYALLFGFAVAHVVRMKLLSPRAPSEKDRALKFVRAAFVWLLFGLAMVLLLPLYHAATEQSFSHNYFAAYRHAIASGFILLMIVGVSSKVVPILCGMDLQSANPLWTAFVLLNLGNAMRILGQVLMDFYADKAGAWMGAAGFMQWAGLLLWAEDLWRAMAATKQRLQEPIALKRRASTSHITPQTKVAEVLDSYPQTLEIFLRYGFEPLKNPLLRKTMAKVVTIEAACRREGVNLQALIEDLLKATGQKT